MKKQLQISPELEVGASEIQPEVMKDGSGAQTKAAFALEDQTEEPGDEAGAQSREAEAGEANPDETVSQKEESKYPGSQQQLYSYALLGWTNYLKHQLSLSDFSASFTVKLGEDQLASIKKTEALPDLEARLAVREELRLLLKDDCKLVTDLFIDGKWYIKMAFPNPALYEIKLKSAGNEYLEAAIKLDWEAATSLISSFKKFLTDNDKDLTANENMPAAFPTKFNAAADVFLAKWLDFKNKKGDVLVETNTKMKDSNQIFEALHAMCEAAKRHFRRNELLRKKFTISLLLKEVRGNEPGGAKGMVTTEVPKNIIIGAQLLAVNADTKALAKEYSATTDKKGKFKLKMAAGEYNITVSAPGFETLTLQGRKVTAGVDGRLGVSLVHSPAPLKGEKTVDALAPNSFDSAIQALMESSAEKSAKPLPSEAYTNGVTG